MSDIVLSGSVRENLLSLQDTARLMSRTQNRLATGKKVNTALDNANAFFTAHALNTRAGDLSALLDSIGQGVQTLKAADHGISSITKLIEAAKAKAHQARLTENTFDRAGFAAEYNALLRQIEAIAKDSGYNGKNLIGGLGNDLTVYFNEDSSNFLRIASVDYGDVASGLGLGDLEEGTIGALSFAMEDAGGTPLTLSSLVVADDTNFSAGGNTLTFTDGNGDPLGAVTVTDTMTVGELVAEINRSFDNVRASFANGTLTIEVTEDVDIAGGEAGGALAAAGLTATASSWHTAGGISASETELTGALRALRAQASAFGTHLTVVQNRQEFTRQLIGTLNSGADLLTLADTNEEGANMLALQTRQQLSTTALSLATQAEQGVLRLFV